MALAVAFQRTEIAGPITYHRSMNDSVPSIARALA